MVHTSRRDTTRIGRDARLRRRHHLRHGRCGDFCYRRHRRSTRKTSPPNEIRGKRINGGETRQLIEGRRDHRPARTPHWFKEVAAPFLYYDPIEGFGLVRRLRKESKSMKIELEIVSLRYYDSSLSLALRGQSELPTKQVLTLESLRRSRRQLKPKPSKRGSTVVIVVVDDGGYLLVLERLDDTQVASVEVGIGKARTAAIFRRPSKVFEDQVRDGRVAALALPGATPLQGGVPIIVEGKVIGAIGVSGNTPQEDEDIAKVGAAAAAALRGFKEVTRI